MCREFESRRGRAVWARGLRILRGRVRGVGSVWVYAGKDPITGKQRYLTGTAPTQRAAERLARQLLGEVQRQRAPRWSMTVAQMIQDWLDTAELEQSTRDGYQSYIANHILPALGKTPAHKVGVETLERFYAHSARAAEPAAACCPPRRCDRSTSSSAPPTVSKSSGAA